MGGFSSFMFKGLVKHFQSKTKYIPYITPSFSSSSLRERGMVPIHINPLKKLSLSLFDFEMSIFLFTTNSKVLDY